MTTEVAFDLVGQLRAIIGTEAVLSAHSDLVVYECDGFVIEKNSPEWLTSSNFVRRRMCRSCRAVRVHRSQAAVCPLAAV